MKKFVLYHLIFLFSFAYSYEMVYILTKTMGNDPISWRDSMECGERGTESEETKEQKEKIDFSEYNHNHTHIILIYIGLLKSDAHQNTTFSSADYSRVIYSPPDIFLYS